MDSPGRAEIRRLRTIIHTHACDYAGSSGSRRVAAVADAVGRLVEPDPLDPASLPVVDRLIPAAPDRASEHTHELASAVVAAAPQLRWVVPYDDEASEPVIARLRAGYAYAAVVEPPSDRPRLAPFVHPDLWLGLTIQAPDVFYPPHSHEAVEVYAVIAGTAQWQHGDGPWVDRPPGSMMVHESFDRHAMHTGSEPLLTWVAFVTALDCQPLLHLDL